MTTNKKFLATFCTGFLIYLFLDIFFNDAVLYIFGGLVGILSKMLHFEEGFLIVWIVLLCLVILIGIKVKATGLKFIVLLMIAVMLYVIDAVMYEILPDLSNNFARYLHIGLGVIIKSLLLAIIDHQLFRRNFK